MDTYSGSSSGLELSIDGLGGGLGADTYSRLHLSVDGLGVDGLLLEKVEEHGHADGLGGHSHCNMKGLSSIRGVQVVAIFLLP